MSRIRTPLHSELPAAHAGAVAVGLEFRGEISVPASTFVGCLFDGRAATRLPKDARLIGCAVDAIASIANQAGTIGLSDPALSGLRSDDVKTRANAVEQIRDGAHSNYLPLLCSRLDDSDWLVRQRILEAASKLWSREQEGAEFVARALCYLLGDEHSVVQMAAQDFAQHIGDDQFTADVVAELDSPLVELRLRALRALVTLHRIGREPGASVAESTWQGLLGYSNSRVRASTLDVLAQIDHRCPKSLIAPLAADADAEVREAAEQLLAELP